MLAPNPVVSGLTAARNLIADPDHWVRGTLARDEHRRDVDPRSSAAIRFCAQGALLRVGLKVSDYGRADELLMMASRQLHGMGYVEVNDGIGHRAIIAVFELAIQMAVAPGDYPEEAPSRVYVKLGPAVFFDPFNQVYVGLTSGAGGGSYSPAQTLVDA